MARADRTPGGSARGAGPPATRGALRAAASERPGCRTSEALAPARERGGARPLDHGLVVVRHDLQVAVHEVLVALLVLARDRSLERDLLLREQRALELDRVLPEVVEPQPVADVVRQHAGREHPLRDHAGEPDARGEAVVVVQRVEVTGRSRVPNEVL